MTADASLRGRLAAHSRWAHEPDRRAATAPARAAGPNSLDYFERQVDPEGTLPAAERATRAAHARSAYFLRLARKSAEARSGRGPTRRTSKANGPAIAAIREAREISIATFASRIGVSYSYLCNIEAGRKPGSPKVLRRIADELGVALDAVTVPVRARMPEAAPA